MNGSRMRSGAGALLLVGAALVLTGALTSCSTSNAPTPTPLAIAGGKAHSLALGDNGTVWAWGNNDYGQLGNGSSGTDVPTPTAVTALNGQTITAIAAGYWHSLALEDNGTVWAWGNNDYGQLGNGSSGGNVTTPTAITALAGHTITAIAAGEWHSFALEDNGTVWAWGNNSDGQLGNGSSGGNVLTPTAVTALAGHTITAIAAGSGHSLALEDNGTVWAWGYNGDGEIGNGDTSGATVPTPTAVTALAGHTITAIAAGDFLSLALEDNGTVWAWGNNGDGEIGNGSSGSDVYTPASFLLQ